ncbi:MAG: GntR family transcriptional regulator [Clostridia bacterium]|nr:GntR family transcriptional regulator [Clostridia bacterium]
MAWSFTSDKPVYLQIAQRITTSVLSGEYKAGEQIPTVRQLALESAVNPNTIQHAFAELESRGLIVSQGTVGRYVTEDTAVIEACRKQTTEQLIKGFVSDITKLSVTKEQIIAMLKEEMQ